MAGNSFGTLFKLTTFGESHGEAIGGIIDGCPAGLSIESSYIQSVLDRRKPGQSHLTTQRKESDSIELLSGVFEGKTTGTPIGFIIRNSDSRPEDYNHLKENYRPSHADYVYDAKYGFRDYRGGGRSSARETAVRVAAGAIAMLLLKEVGVKITAYVSSVGNIYTDENQIDFSEIENNLVRCPNAGVAHQMEVLIEEAKKQGDSLGGVITTVIEGVPAGWGEPVFDKLHADLGKAMLSVNAVKGFEIGSGFKSSCMKGSEHNDIFVSSADGIKTTTNHSGGVQGGISNGQPIVFRTAFKPVATIMQKQASVNRQGEEITLQAKGRHDPCVLPRAVPIIEAMAALTLADHFLRNKSAKF
ncbi:MAG: chorismate synthase [Flavobacteriales bacterium]